MELSKPLIVSLTQPLRTRSRAGSIRCIEKTKLTDFILCLGKQPIVHTFRAAGPLKQTASIPQIAILDLEASAVPGNIVQGAEDQLANGSLAVITALPRRGGTFVISGAQYAQPSDSYSVHVETLNPENATRAVQALRTKPFLPGQVKIASLSVSQVYSKESAALELGASFSGWGANASAFFQTASSTEETHFVFGFVQPYYSISFTPDVDPGDPGPGRFFDRSVTPHDASLYMSETNPPLLVSTVTYGRALYCIASSKLSADDMKLVLDASYSSLAAHFSIHAAGRHAELLRQITTNALAIGGKTVDVGKVFGSATLGPDTGEALSAYVSNGLDVANAATNNRADAEPLFYTLSYLADGTPADLGAIVYYEPPHVTTESYGRIRFEFCITNDDKEHEAEVSATLSSRDDGTVYFNGVIQPATSDNAGYWGTHGACYPSRDIGTKTLVRRLPAYEKGDLHVQIRSTGNNNQSWEATLTIYGECDDGSEVILFNSGNLKFNKDGNNGINDMDF